VWQGYFTLEDEILWNSEEKRSPYSLLFDTRTWVDIRPIKTKRFRGFTYTTPELDDIERVAP